MIDIGCCNVHERFALARLLGDELRSVRRAQSIESETEIADAPGRPRSPTRDGNDAPRANRRPAGALRQSPRSALHYRSFCQPIRSTVHQNKPSPIKTQPIRYTTPKDDMKTRASVVSAKKLLSVADCRTPAPAGDQLVLYGRVLSHTKPPVNSPISSSARTT